MSLKSSETSAMSGQLGNSLVRVFFRIFPEDKPKWDVVKLGNNSTVFVKKMLPCKKNNVCDFWKFVNDGVFNNCNQEKVFEAVVGDLLEKLDYGQNGVIISFGKPSTGKSATMAGLDLSQENYGIGPRIIKRLLSIKKSLQKNKKMCIRMSNVEFSHNDVSDLFKEYPNRIENHWKVAQRLRKIKIHSEIEALRELYAGEGRKETKAVNNYISHMYTSILTFYVTTKDMEFNEPRQITGKIHLVDMAGSDTIGNLSSIFKTKLELSVANLNKSYMEQFFLALCQRSNEMIKIKQRINPLIYFLGSDVRMQSSLRFIGHITTGKDDYPLTVSMLRFGQIVRGYTPTVVNLDYEISPEYKLKYLQNKVEELEKERIQNSILLNQDLSLNLNCERVQHLNKTIKEYLRNEITEIDVMSVADASVIFKMFKDMLEQKEIEKQTIRGESDILVKTKASITHTKDRRSSLTKKPYRISTEKVEKQISIPSLEKGTETQKVRSQTFKVLEMSSSSVNHLKAPKKVKSKLTNVVRPSLKRRSVLSMNGSESTGDQPFLPDNIPENMEIWLEYCKKNQYILLTEEYKANEKNIVNAYTEYLAEIKKLHVFKDEIEVMKQELLEAKILLKFKEKARDVDKYTEAILNEAELLCQNNMERAKATMHEQQEVVLTQLAELKIYLNNRKELRRKLSEDFENYCKMKYSMPIPQAKSLSEMELVKESKYSTIEVEGHPSSMERDLNLDILELKRNKELSKLKKITNTERKNFQKMKYVNKPYLLATLPEHRDPTRI